MAAACSSSACGCCCCLLLLLLLLPLLLLLLLLLLLPLLPSAPCHAVLVAARCACAAPALRRAALPEAAPAWRGVVIAALCRCRARGRAAGGAARC